MFYTFFIEDIKNSFLVLNWVPTIFFLLKTNNLYLLLFYICLLLKGIEHNIILL